ncbi:MAG: hypothetical protein KF721_03175 [Ignavibacteriaceae bacterium]|nr:hypothetical protein [Ignavibacteriaceae bacterium]HRI45777.1 hypothetical protein [Ignavibacteriaceae bacterium]
MNKHYLSIFIVILFSTSTQNLIAQVELSNQIWFDQNYSKAIIAEVDESELYEATFYNHSYLHSFIWSYGFKTPAFVVVSQNSKWRIGNFEGVDPELKSKAFLIQKGEKVKSLWELTTNSDKGEIFDEFYKTTWVGCCGTISNSTLYNLLNGTKILEFTEPVLSFKVFNTSPSVERLIGFKNSFTELKEVYEEEPFYIGTITYSSRSSVISKLAVYNNNNADDPMFPSSIEFVSMKYADKISEEGKIISLFSDNGNSDKNIFSDFEVQITFDQIDEPLIVKVNQDNLSFDSKLNKGYKVKRIK